MSKELTVDTKRSISCNTYPTTVVCPMFFSAYQTTELTSIFVSLFSKAPTCVRVPASAAGESCEGSPVRPRRVKALGQKLNHRHWVRIYLSF